MRDTSLLQLALGLVPPWAVIRSEFDAEARQLDIHIDFAAGSRFACPCCGAADCPAYDTEQMSWRHLDFFQHQAFLYARVPRVHCTRCGIKTLSVPWARPDSGFTLLFEALGGRCCVSGGIVVSVSLHAVARRMQRGFSTNDETILSELRQIAVMYSTIVESLGDFSIPGDGGLWCGEVGRNGSAPLLAIRTFTPAGAPVTGTAFAAVAYA